MGGVTVDSQVVMVTGVKSICDARELSIGWLNIDENGSQREEPVGRRVYVGFGTIWGNVLSEMWFRKDVVVEVGLNNSNRAMRHHIYRTLLSRGSKDILLKTFSILLLPPKSPISNTIENIRNALLCAVKKVISIILRPWRTIDNFSGIMLTHNGFKDYSQSSHERPCSYVINLRDMPYANLCPPPPLIQTGKV
ncbi:hypothetical protein TNCT_232591 [Trichonephila clavata]|uniref:Uncharacterized protein n=1 Tax=Trichonephila clavata TaxID=2740835 RepID=A0A8X6LN03_TRICU|nr:hypothetical protein TNCT_232591 [Trichonephila clavata]